MFSFVFGIPLSFAALAHRCRSGDGARYRVDPVTVRVVTKLLIVVSVMIVGGSILGQACNQLLDGDTDATGRLIAGATYDVVHQTVATALGVFKPGRPFRRTHQACSRNDVSNDD